MAAHSGSNIVKDGLVFKYDMGNRLKSWINPPGKNQFGYTVSGGYLTQSTPEKATLNVNDTNAGWGHWGPSGISYSKAANTDPDFIWDKNNSYSHKITCNSSSTVNLLFYRTLPFEGQEFGSVVAGWGGGNPSLNERSFRYIIKRSDSGPIDGSIVGLVANNVVHYHPFGDGVHYATRSSAPSSSSPWSEINYLGNGWYELIANHLLQDGRNDLVGINISPGYTVYIGFAQMEEASIISKKPFVGERSATEALLDPIKNTPITPNSIVYDSEGSFSFNGTGEFSLPAGSIDLTNTSFTIDLWVKRDNMTGNVTVFGHESIVGAQTSIHYRLYSTGLIRFDFYSNSINGGNFVAGEWTHLVTTYDFNSDTCTGYQNGVQIATGSVGPYLGNSSTSVTSFGSWITRERLVGQLPTARIYDRALTAAEVKQNFEASRKSFGV